MHRQAVCKDTDVYKHVLWPLYSGHPFFQEKNEASRHDFERVCGE